MNIAFKTIKYGDNKGDVLAVLTDTPIKDGNLQAYILFEGIVNISKEYVRTQTRNATVNEYSSTKANLIKDLGVSNINITNKVNYVCK